MDSPVSATGSDHSAASASSAANNNNNGAALKRGSSTPQHSPQPLIGSGEGNENHSPMMRAGPLQHGQSGIQQPGSSPLMQHAAAMQLTPPPVSTPNGLGSLGGRLGPSALSHLPPPGLGLLNSLQMMHHASPLELMAVAQHHHGGPPRSYNSPPPISSSDPAANECKLVDYRGQKVAAFIISGETMLCLPQAFELFLKHLVGGLHTVYTKLKRLDIVPLVCNVEQVRILRGLGAIQPGVNRCKLLSCKDFDVLYRDCTTAR